MLSPSLLLLSLAPQAVAAADHTPLLSAPLSLAAEESATFDLASPFALRSAGLWWDGQAASFSVAMLRPDGSAGPAFPVVSVHDLSPESTGASGRAGTAQVGSLVHEYGDPAIGVRLVVEGPASLQELSVVWIAPSDRVPHPRTSVGGASGRAYPKPPVNSRAAWGADPAVCTPSYCTTTHVGVHHTANANEYLSNSWSQCASNVKSVQSFHMYTRGWCDIGYNYLVCVHGQIWEGRGGGDDVRGAHDGANCGSMGVSMMGYFHTPHNQVPNAAMLDALAELGAWKCDQQGIDPFGTSWYAGYGGNMSNVYGHRNVSATACPGDLGYAELPGLRTAIENKINGGGGGGNPIILDTDRAATTGSWTTGTSSGDKYGSNYLWASTGTALRYAWWEPQIPTAGVYQVSLWWPQGSNRNPATQVGLRKNGQLFTTSVNQQTSGGQWNVLGSVWLAPSDDVKVGVSNAGPAGFVVMADALRLVKQ